MSNCSSVNFGMTILNFIVSFPTFPVFGFSIPLFWIVIILDFVVTPDLYIGIYYSFRWVIVFLNPNMASFRDISTVWMRFYPYLAHFYVGISTIVTYKSEGAPVIGSSPKLLIFNTFPSGNPFGILILTFSGARIVLLPLHSGHNLVGCLPQPKQTEHVFSFANFWPNWFTP